MSLAPSEPKPLRLPRTVRVIFALIMREMATTYGRSSLGYLWAVLEPIGGIAVLTIAFSVFLRSPPIGDSFALFYASGFLPFSVWARIQGNIMMAIQANRALLFYPEVRYIDAIFARYLLALLTQSLVCIIVLGGIIVMDGVRVQVDLPIAVLSIVVASLLGIGMGTLNSVLIHVIPSYLNVWSIATRPLFIASGVFFLFDTMPTWAQNILWYNPLVHVVGMMRLGLYTTYDGAYVSVAYPLAVAAITMLIGLLLLRRLARDIINF
jgi:capsular polysaccharide transport system permease protein